MKRITGSDIKKILANKKLSGKTLDVPSIKSLVSSSYNLSSDDKLPYTTTRRTTYSYWEAQVQRTLFHLSHDGSIIHNSGNNSYTF